MHRPLRLGRWALALPILSAAVGGCGASGSPPGDGADASGDPDGHGLELISITCPGLARPSRSASSLKNPALKAQLTTDRASFAETLRNAQRVRQSLHPHAF